MNDVHNTAVLQMVVRAAQLGLWDWEIATGRVVYSPEWKQQLGYGPAEIEDRIEEWRRLVHPDDGPRMQQLIADYLASPRPHYEAEFRIRHRDGSWRWMRAYADLICDEKGRPTRMLGSHLDITDFKRTEAALRRANRMLRLRSEASGAVLRATEERTLLQQVCEAAVAVGGYAGAWVTATTGAAEDVRWCARAGDGPLPLAGFGAVPGADGTATVSVQSTATSSAVLRPTLSTPLLIDGQVFGALTVMGSTDEEFSATDHDALQELGNDVAVGVQMLRTRLHRDEVLTELSRSQSRLAEAERIAHVGCWEWDRTTGSVAWSEEVFRILGLNASAVTASWPRLKALVHPDDRERVDAFLHRPATEGTALEMEFRLVRPDGEVRQVLSRAAASRRPPSGAEVVVGTLQDITERKQAEDALRTSIVRVLRHEATLLALTKPDPCAATDLRLALQRLTAASAQALQVARVSVWRPTADQSAIECVDLYELATGAHSAGLVVTAAEHSRYFAALAESEVLSTEDAWSDERTAEFLEGYLRPLGIAAMMDVPIRLKGELAGVLCHEHIGGRRAWSPEERTFALAISNLVTLALEEDARRRVQAVQQQTERAYAALVGTIEGIVWEVDLPSYRFTFVSPQAERLLGYPVARWLEEPDFWINHMHPDDRRWAPEFCRRATAAGENHDFHYRMIHADGHTVWLHDLVTLVREGDESRRLRGIMVDVTETKRAEEALHAREQEYRALVENSPDLVCRYDREGRILYANPAFERLMGVSREELIGTRGLDRRPDHAGLRHFYEQVARVFTTGTPTELDLVLDFLPAANSLVHYIRLVPERDQRGAVVSVLGIGRDITAIRQTEKQLREAEERFRQAQKMEAVGRLAGGIAHDFNNLLAVIQLQSDLLLGDQAAADVTRDGVQQIKAAAERASRLTRQLLTFSRREMPQARLIDLAEVMGSMSSLLRRVLGEDIVLETEFAPRLPLVEADPGMMEQVVMNLAVNSRDAMPDGGRLRIALATIEADAARVEASAGVSPGRFVCLAVSDTGSGIRPEDLPHVFEPFFTTKEVGRGTGLGLSTVFGIAQQHRGWVEVESEWGNGACFRVYLPAVAPRVREAPAGGNGPNLPGGQERVLLVEDDPSVRSLARMALEKFGYRVCTAESGVAALEVWREQGPTVDVLLTDLVMPGGLGGAELAEQLLAQRPGLKVMYMSGYSSEMVEGRLAIPAGRHFLAKPFSVSDLLHTIRRCLDAG